MDFSDFQAQNSLKKGTHAIVIGGSIAGMLAGRILTNHFDREPLLFHTGWRKLFPLVREAIATVMPVERLRYIALSHYEADECGALDRFLAIALEATPMCGKIAAMTSVDDTSDRPARALADGEEVNLGQHVVQWLDTPHLPHAWDCGYLLESTTKTLLPTFRRFNLYIVLLKFLLSTYSM